MIVGTISRLLETSPVVILAASETKNCAERPAQSRAIPQEPQRVHGGDNADLWTKPTPNQSIMAKSMAKTKLTTKPVAMSWPMAKPKPVAMPKPRGQAEARPWRGQSPWSSRRRTYSGARPLRWPTRTTSIWSCSTEVRGPATAPRSSQSALVV